MERTEKTEQAYLKRAKLLIERAAREYGMTVNEVSPMVVARFLHNERVNLSKATFRQYKASLLFYFEQAEQFDVKERENAMQLLIDTDQCDCLKSSERTSALRRKRFHDETYQNVLYALSRSNSSYARVTIKWLEVGTLTGLRPHEWANAEIIEDETDIFLRVKNAKNTNARSHGMYRHINLNNLSEDELLTIKEFLEIVEMSKKNGDADISKLQENCMKLLTRVNNKLIKGELKKIGFDSIRGGGVYSKNDKKPTRITLYSARHRFSSMAKANLSLDEVAALMGHKTDKTASLHYGTKAFGRSGHFKVQPNKAEVAKIEQKYNAFMKGESVIQNINIQPTQNMEANIETKVGVNGTKKRMG